MFASQSGVVCLPPANKDKQQINNAFVTNAFF
jgi:hypothetical protein